MGALAEFCNFNESRFESELTPEVKETQPPRSTENFRQKLKKFSLY
jgi:hypothetical protein